MITSISVFILFAVIQVISSRDGQDHNRPPFIDPSIPKDCWGPPEGTNLFQCCPLPSMHNEKDLEECNIPRPSPVNPPPPRDPHDCTPKLCLLRNKDLLNDDDTIHVENMKTFIDAWAKNQTHIKEAVEIAKDLCFGENGPLGPQKPFGAEFDRSCEPDKLYKCMTTNILWNCKLREDISMCKVLKEHMDGCRQYLFKDPPK